MLSRTLSVKARSPGMMTGYAMTPIKRVYSYQSMAKKHGGKIAKGTYPDRNT
jgi:hypothetical protein